MRRLGRLAGKIRLGFLEGLRGRAAPPAAVWAADASGGVEPDPGVSGGLGVEIPAGGRVIVRRTIIEELEIHDPDRR